MSLADQSTGVNSAIGNQTPNANADCLLACERAVSIERCTNPPALSHRLPRLTACPSFRHRANIVSMVVVNDAQMMGIGSETMHRQSSTLRHI
jgi:hypothetical protein